jgi:hypothetical protein
VLAAEHALELELLDFPAHGIDVAHHFGDGGLVVLGLRHLEQISGITETLVEPVELPDQNIELCPLATQRFGARRVLPDCRVFQRALDFGQPLFLAIEVKDTPEARPNAREAGG